ncbi:hypothetical protein [uncultured Microbacterium sp.]|uniref:hypothetical protein n=1 Tax=uncultured Microbacterium sp. TaxID=191216 RepID=UPI00260E1057|nr:hypothetical protein [uncultured Microbacterium sp.]
MRSPALAASAAAVLALEGAVLATLAIIELFGLGAGRAAVPTTAIALIVLTLIGAGALFAFAWGTRSGRTWARSGGVMLQVLVIAFALASLGVEPVPWIAVLGAGIPGIVGFVLLMATTSREGRPEKESPADSAQDSAGE